ncbi:DUF2275 domain-containing protein [Trichlorobacter lovleyi]|uniref:DUF2275 domain-containing protein n=1 Tax=Trichlorobacter lovleyi TaxID=313985 RepID=UPI00223EBB0C|nr:DUF2275 domain-containing protein [Trichlorobacter lovleyi]QOX78394.1 DUF2275 domain-containing protein [Trichlorobacter lovleyi]
MKTHEELRSMLPALAGGELTEVDRTVLEQHLAECESCRRELGQLQAVVQAIRSTAELEPPSWLAPRIMAQIREEAVPRNGWFARLFLPLQVKLPLEALALVLICATAWYVMQDVERSQQRPRTVSEADRKAAPQVSRGTEPAAAPPVVPQTAPAPAQRSQADSGFAPAPVPERAASPEQSRSAVESAPPATGYEPSAGAPAPAAERGMAAKRKAERGDSRLDAAMPSPLRVGLVASDPAAVSDQLWELVRSLGGELLERRNRTVLIRIQGSRLPELFERLARLGRISERPSGELPRDAWLQVQIIW